ncbi:unnamed protein product, partial [Tuber aestivum]
MERGDIRAEVDPGILLRIRPSSAPRTALDPVEPSLFPPNTFIKHGRLLVAPNILLLPLPSPRPVSYSRAVNAVHTHTHFRQSIHRFPRSPAPSLPHPLSRFQPLFFLLPISRCPGPIIQSFPLRDRRLRKNKEIDKNKRKIKDPFPSYRSSPP